MGNSKLYWGPTVGSGVNYAGPGTLGCEVIDLGSILGLVDFEPFRNLSQSEGGTGATYSYCLGGGTYVGLRIVLSLALAEAFVPLETQLKDGGPCAFAHDSAQVWASPIVTDPERGDTNIPYQQNLFELWAGVVNPVAGWRCVIESPLPQLRREIIAVAAVNTGSHALTATGRGSHGGLVYNYRGNGLAATIRPKLFFPHLKLMPGQGDLIRQRGAVYTFEAAFFLDLDIMNYDLFYDAEDWP